MKYLLLIFSFSLICSASSQSNDLVLDRIFHRSNVGDFFEKGLEYFQMPASQLRSIECSALVSNTGENDITNCYLEVQVIKDDTILYTFFSDSVSIGIGIQDSLQINSGIDLTGEPVGLYTFEYTVFSDSSEIDYSNNMNSFDFGITEHLLSRSDFAIHDSTKSYYPDSLNIRSFGYAFKMENDACIGAIYPWVTHSPINSELSLRLDGTLFVLDTTTENNFTPLAFFEWSLPSIEELGGAFRMDFEYAELDANQLEAGKTYLITVNSYSQTHDFYLSQETMDSTIFNAFTDGSPGSPFIDIAPLSNARMIKMDIEFGTGYHCTLNVAENTNSHLAIYPNPAIGQIKVAYDFQEDAILRILNLNGQIIKEVRGLNASKNNPATIDMKGITSGFYFVQIISENKSISQRITIQ